MTRPPATPVIRRDALNGTGHATPNDSRPADRRADGLRANARDSANRPVSPPLRPVVRHLRHVGKGQRRPPTRRRPVRTAFDFETPDFEGAGTEYRLNLRQSMRSSRTPPLVVNDGYVGYRFGAQGQVRVRAGHMWLPDSARRAGSRADSSRPPAAPVGRGVRRARRSVRRPRGPRLHHGLCAERPESRRLCGARTGIPAAAHRRLHAHPAGAFVERSVVTVTNFVPMGFAGLHLPGGGVRPHRSRQRRGTSRAGVPARQRARDCRTAGRSAGHGPAGPIDRRAHVDRRTAQRTRRDAGAPRRPAVRVGGRTRDRRSRAKHPHLRWLHPRPGQPKRSAHRPPAHRWTRGKRGWFRPGRVRLEFAHRLPAGDYHSSYVSIGHSLGRRGYLSVDYATSLSVVRFIRSDGVVIDTRPRTRRVSGNGSFRSAAASRSS